MCLRDLALPHCHVVATGEAVVWCDIALQGCLYRGPSLQVRSYNTDAPETNHIKHTVQTLTLEWHIFQAVWCLYKGIFYNQGWKSFSWLEKHKLQNLDVLYIFLWTFPLNSVWYFWKLWDLNENLSEFFSAKTLISMFSHFGGNEL